MTLPVAALSVALSLMVRGGIEGGASEAEFAKDTHRQRIRLYVSSSDFPNFDRNHNTGNPYYSDTELRVAHQRVFHTEEMASCLVLPVVG